jgi:hypothetical protein
MTLTNLQQQYFKYGNLSLTKDFMQKSTQIGTLWSIQLAYWQSIVEDYKNLEVY